MVPVSDVTPDELDRVVETTRGELVVLYLWGPDCPNCEVFAGRLPILREQLGDVPARILKLDAYAYPELARRYGVYGIPCFLLFRDAKKIGRMSEFRGDAFWLGVVREHLPVA